MILIRSKKFGKGEKSVIDGYYKRMERGIKFFMPNGDLFAYLCANDPWYCFFVNAFMFDGETHYQFSTGSATEARLGIEGMGYGEKIDIANAIWKAANLNMPVSSIV